MRDSRVLNAQAGSQPTLRDNMAGSAEAAAAASGQQAAELLARIESVPFSRWHTKARVVIGSSTFFDAFDALSLAFVLPVLVGLWQMDREDLLAGMLLFRVLYYIAPFVISVILLTFREVMLGTRMKRQRETAPALDAGPPREAAYVRKRGDPGA